MGRPISLKGITRQELLRALGNADADISSLLNNLKFGKVFKIQDVEED